ncbi:MAG: protein tyrosine phosphatase [Clostridia bacterium]|nr:protein tyrosine phosphatase [Clostridia bacterium]
MAEKRNIIDIHTHILPGIDDGSKNWDMTIEMARISWQKGVRKIIATPHYLPWRPETNPNQIKTLCKDAEKKIQEALGIQMGIYSGQEIYYHLDMLDNLKKQKIQTMNDSNYLLIEFDTSISWRELKHAAQTTINAGYKPILAHVERYDCLREKGRVDELSATGAHLQINVRSLSGGIFDSDTNWSRKQVKAGKIAFLASDMHNLTSRRPYNSKGLEWFEKKMPEATVENLLCRNANKYFGI